MRETKLQTTEILSEAPEEHTDLSLVSYSDSSVS